MARWFLVVGWALGLASACDGGASDTTGRCDVSFPLPLTCAGVEAAIGEEVRTLRTCTVSTACTVVNDPRCADGGYPLAVREVSTRLECLVDLYYVEASCPDISCDWTDPIPSARCEEGQCAWW